MCNSLYISACLLEQPWNGTSASPLSHQLNSAGVCRFTYMRICIAMQESRALLLAAPSSLVSGQNNLAGAIPAHHLVCCCSWCHQHDAVVPERPGRAAAFGKSSSHMQIQAPLQLVLPTQFSQARGRATTHTCALALVVAGAALHVRQHRMARPFGESRQPAGAVQGGPSLQGVLWRYGVAGKRCR